MSNGILPTEKMIKDWRLRIRVDPYVRKLIVAEAKERDRHCSWVVGHILEEHYAKGGDANG